ncbi:MAG TPA: hypothetical protein VNY52_06330 [Solirubrobacteraceae bacterium]|nr:hypothetical protein [Solirubrobacteraceae bacterium]
MILLSLLALPVIGAATSPAALAACGKGEKAVWCVGGKAFRGVETYVSTGNVFKLEVTIEKASIAIECGAETGDGTIEKERSGTNSNIYSKCSVVGDPKCEVEEPIKASNLNTGLKVAAGKFYNEFNGELLAKIGLKNKGEEVCLLKGKYEVKGTGCSEVGPEAVKLVWRFSKAIEEACKTELTFFKEGSKVGKATLTGESKLTLAGANKGQEWGAGLV